MRSCKIVVESVPGSPYSQSNFHKTPKLDRESSADYEERTWRERLYVDEKGFVFIPSKQFSSSIKLAAKRLGMKIPGKGQSTYTKHFLSGFMVLNDITLPVKKSDIQSVVLLSSSDGIPGSSKKVEKIFGIVPSWSGELEVTIFDDTITQSVFEQVFKEAGMFIGIGRWRPERGGMNGRYMAKKFIWA